MSNGNPRSSGASRRDFLKLAAGSLGGVLLGAGTAGCGGNLNRFGHGGGGGLGSPIPSTPLPNGYVFYRMLTPGDNTFPDLQTLGGGVMNNDAAVMFLGQRATGQNAVYEIDLQYNGSSMPTIQDSAVRISEGDTQDGNLVYRIHSAAIDNGGIFSSLAVVVSTEGQVQDTPSAAGTPMVLFSDQGGDLTRLVGLEDPTPDGGRFGAHFGDIAINSNRDIMLCADYSIRSPQGLRVQQGAFLIPYGASPQNGTVLAQASSATPGASSLPSRLGMCDIDDQRRYVLQAFASPGGNSVGGAMASGLLGGVAGERPNLIAGSPMMGGGRSRVTAPGNIYMGPRVRNGIYSTVVHTTDDQHALVVSGQVLTQTGSPSPGGSTIQGVGPASVSGNGLLHYLVTTDAGMELVVSNDRTQKTILKYGDMLANSTSPIVGIVHGMHSDQSDTQGNISFVGEFADGSQSIVIGIPV